MTDAHSNDKPTDDLQQSLYAKREKIYPREVHGWFAALRVSGVSILLGFYYIMPWFMWDGRQAILFDLPERKFYVLGMIFWPQDFIYLTLMLVVASLALFFFTALAGRLWCGFACPQTVWTESFLWIERKIEGTRAQQMKLDKMPWNANKVIKKSTKHFLWLTFSLYTGFTFVGYFSPIQQLSIDFINIHLGPWEFFWIFFYGFATYGNAGWLREQVCKYMCPYARFQSAMIDNDTLIISYDEKRGDPRGSRKKGSDPAVLDLGSCIDCSICVQVCPTGIDIRDGLQYECIGCAACIDACDDVMEKMDYPKGLIKYTTMNTIDGNKTNVFRPRIIVYMIILIAVTMGTIASIAARSPIELDIIRDRNILFRETDEGLIENVYTIKIINKDDQAHEYHITASGIENMQLLMSKKHIVADSGLVIEVPVRLVVDPEYLNKRSTTVLFHLNAIDADLSTDEEARFLGPQ